MNGVFCHEIHLCNTNVEIHESGWIGSFFQHVHITDAPLKPGEIQWLCCGLAATLKPVFFSSIRSFGGLLSSSGRPPARPPLAHLHLHLPTYFQSYSRTFQKDFPTKEMWDQTHLWLEWILSSVASGSLPAVKARAAHLLCLDCDTCSRYDTVDLLIAPASLLQDASLILFTKPPVNSSKMAFRSRARQFERKLSQTFLSRLRGRERSSVEVVNSSSSGFMRVVTRWSPQLFNLAVVATLGPGLDAINRFSCG